VCNQVQEVAGAKMGERHAEALAIRQDFGIRRGLVAGRTDVIADDRAACTQADDALADRV